MTRDNSGLKILAVDDNADALFALEQLLASEGYQVVTASSGQETLEKVSSEVPDLVLLDVRMPDMSGLEVAKQVKSDAQLRFIPITLLTSLDSIDDVLLGFDAGADDYIVKPFEKAELLARVRAQLRLKATYDELKRSELLNHELEKRIESRAAKDNIVGDCAGMREIFTVIDKVSASDVPVLVLGETGTGKELIATALHASSKRAGKAFLAQNCSAFSESLLESELFGHVRGAFSGALRDKPGLLEVADGGTFFLDELGEMSLPLQAKLLRFLQDGTFIPVGSTRPKKVDVRIIAATHRDLERMITEGKFREDLYYRLNVVSLKLPPLRERKDDIPKLVQHFITQSSKRNRKNLASVSNEALKHLVAYTWPGNIRELQNEIERLVILASEETVAEAAQLSAKIRTSAVVVKTQAQSAATLKEATDALERAMIEDALKQTQGNKSEAAKRLGISRSNLISKVQGYGISDEAVDGE